MFNFQNFEERHFLEFLKQGYLDEYIEEILSIFSQLTPKLQFSLIVYVRENLKGYIHPRVLAKVLNISINDAEKILFAKSRTFEIILTQPENFGILGKGKFCQAILIPQTSKIITNLGHLKPKLKVIKSFMNQGFAVFFDEFFKGDSFMLPLAVYLGTENIPKDLRFTGKLDTKGNILEIEFLREKALLCEEHNLRLVSPVNVKNFREIKNYLDRKSWNIPFYITTAGKEEFNTYLYHLREKVTENFEEFISKLTLFYNLREENFYLVTGQLKEKDDWVRVCEEFYSKIYLIKNKLPGEKVFHLALRSATTLSFALGVIFSHFDPFVFYHYQSISGKTNYYPISVLTPRELKERIRSYQHIKPYFEKAGEDLVVILNFSHHEPFADVKAYVLQILKAPSFLMIESEWKGNIPINKFFHISKETASFLQEIRQKHHFRSYHFFFSCPLPIAFLVGLAFGHYVDGFIYNYQKEGSTYEQVLDFKILRKIREKMSENS